MKRIFLSVVLFFGIIALLTYVSFQKTTVSQPVAADRVTIGNAIFTVVIADTDAERTLGLSGRTTLDPDTGLLFIFENPSRAGIWMKDMNIPIDILWFDQDLKLISVKENATPASYPDIFYPTKNALYVLEVPTGTIRSHNISIGQQATFSRK